MKEKEGQGTPGLSVHTGHRERVKKKFLSEGLDRFEPHEVLELLLYYVIPQKDTNPTAHALLRKFGSLSGVFDAPFEELVKTEGVGKSAATLIKLIPQICRRYRENAGRDRQRVFSYEAAGRLLVDRFVGRSDEVVVLMLLDSRSNVIYCGVVSEGTATTANIYVRKIVRLAVQYNAVFAILAHNHPSGNCLPSKQDLESTRWVYQALQTVEVELADHMIVSGEDFLSIAKSGILPDLFHSGLDTE